VDGGETSQQCPKDLYAILMLTISVSADKQWTVFRVTQEDAHPEKNTLIRDGLLNGQADERK